MSGTKFFSGPKIDRAEDVHWKDPTAGAVVVWEHYKSKKGGDKQYTPPEGTLVNLHQCFQPGWYARTIDGQYVKFAHHATRCCYIACHRFNYKDEFVYAFILKPDHAYIGVAALYCDNLVTKTIDFNFMIGRKWPGYPNAANVPEVFAKCREGMLAEVFTPSTNHYDTGYPRGKPLRQVAQDLLRDLSVDPPDFTEYEYDDELYHEFAKRMEEFRASKGHFPIRSGRTRKLGITRFDQLKDTYWFRRLDVNTEKFLEGRNNLVLGRAPLAVGVLPKIGPTKSDGTVRQVFPCSPGLQIAHDTAIGKRDPEYTGATRVKGAKFPRMPWTYDIISADKTIGFYLHRYLREHSPDMIPLFFPPVITKDGIRFANQLLSGIPNTTGIVEAFTVALATITKQMGADDAIFYQGDGIMSRFPLRDHKYLRSCPEYTINGFCYKDPAGPHYINGPERLSTPRLVRPGKLAGKAGWHYRYEIYLRFLRAENLPNVKRMFAHLTDRELLDLAWKHNLCARKLHYMGISTKYDEIATNHHWDYTNTSPTAIAPLPPAPNFPRFCVSGETRLEVEPVVEPIFHCPLTLSARLSVPPEG